MSGFVRRCAEIMCERHERLLAFFYELYKSKPAQIQEGGVPLSEVLEALSGEDWAKPPEKWLWHFWTDGGGKIQCRLAEEDLEQLHERGYIYIDANNQIWPTVRARLTLGQNK